MKLITFSLQAVTFLILFLCLKRIFPLNMCGERDKIYNFCVVFTFYWKTSPTFCHRYIFNYIFIFYLEILFIINILHIFKHEKLQIKFLKLNKYNLNTQKSYPEINLNVCLSRYFLPYAHNHIGFHKSWIRLNIPYLYILIYCENPPRFSDIIVQRHV